MKRRLLVQPTLLALACAFGVCAAGCGISRPLQAPPASAAPAAVQPPAYPPPPDIAPPARPAPSPPNQQASYVAPDVPPPADPANLYEPARIVARVGDQPIIMGELLAQVNQMLAPFEGKYPEDQIELQRQKLVKQLLQVKIDTKLMYLDFLREFPDRSKLPEVEERIVDMFNEKQLPVLMEKAGVDTPGELDVYLRRFGSSLEQARQSFIEQVMASQSRNRHIDNDPEITHEEMLQYYHRNIKQYQIPAKVKWEQLMVRLDRFPSREAAYAAIAAMGNEVLHGAPLAAVARRRSQGVRASQGGLHDWTNQGSLVSEVLDHYLFTLPPGKLSQIIEDQDGLHIVRVIERRPARVVPFVEAQVEIKEQLRKQKIKKQQEKYLARLRQQTPVWTVFDDQQGHGQHPSGRRPGL